MAGIGGRQTSVNVQPAPAVVGDFCDLNPRFVVDAGPGGFVAGPSGVVVGRFVWASNPLDPNSAPTELNNYGSGPVTGIVANEQQALNATYLADAGLTIQPGFGVTAYSGCGIWVKNEGSTQALRGQYAYASFANGAVNFAAANSVATGGTSTASTIAAETFSVTASITGNILSVSAVGSGIVYPGSTISGTGVASGTQVQQQLTPLLTGEAYGGVGRYYVSIGEQTVASETISGTYGLLTVGGTVAGSYGVNDVLSGTGVVAGTTISAQNSTATPALTGTGGAGTYVVNNNTAISSEAINVAATNVQTKWVAMSSGLPGELVKISSQPLG
jgi:hypothetical protein